MDETRAKAIGACARRARILESFGVRLVTLA